MIGSCTTSSCLVDSAAMPWRSGSTLTECSSCLVYEYEMDSLDSVVRQSDASSRLSRGDCSAVKAAASLSWSTVHSAPAVLGRLGRYRVSPAVSYHHHHRPHPRLCDCAQARDRRDAAAAAVARHGRDRRDEFCVCQSPFYRRRYRPLHYANTITTATAAAAAASASDNQRYDKLYPSLAIAKPVLAETQYWV